MILARTLYALCIAILLAACSGSGSIPSESDGRSALEQKIQKQSNGLIRLISFQKTNGIEQDIFGMKQYRLEYTAEIEILGDCAWVGNDGIVGWDGRFNTNRGKSRSKGERHKVSAYLEFEKAENGWRIVN